MNSIEEVAAKMAKMRKPSKKRKTAGREYARSMLMIGWACELLSLAIRKDREMVSKIR
jgi:hypothetical protein